MAAVAGCGEDGETLPGGGAGGEGGAGGGGGSGDCTMDDPFDLSQCPESYPELQCVVHVDAAVDSSGDGWTWQTAVKTVQEGIDRAHCGAVQAGVCEQWQVWVRQGSHYIYQGCRTDWVRLRPQVGVYGGFSGSETALYERDWEQHETILDGSDGPGGNQHVYHVVLGADDAVLDGVTVTGGRADSEDDYNHQSGGGMANISSSPLVAHCTFRDNEARDHGGGMINHLGSSPTVVGCTFINNRAGSTGGAINTDAGGSPTVADCTIRDNEAGSGAISLWHGVSMTLTNTSFLDNSATYGGGVAVYGGAIFIHDVSFQGHSTSRGGGLYAEDGAEVEVHHSSFVENLALAGGGIFVQGGSSIQVWDSFVSSNTASDLGGGIRSASSSASFRRCEVSGNVAFDHGGGLDAYDSTVEVVSSAFADNHAGAGRGGGAKVTDGSLLLVNSTLASNTATAGGGAISSDADLTIRNSILWANGADEVDHASNWPISVSYSNVSGGHAGTANLDVDPLFVDLEDGDLHLSAGSLCIDVADGTQAPGTDLEGNGPVDDPDMEDGTSCTAPCPDMGAYEFLPSG